MQAPPWHRRAVLSAIVALGATPLRVLAAPFTAQADPFALGVASGDPSRDGFVLWTRLVGPDAHPLRAGSIPVRYEVAEDEGFRDIVRTG
ncbi:MAG: PhoD-like phosphatase N-terminal domain-containing protein, partial [Sphingobium limneticum]